MTTDIQLTVNDLVLVKDLISTACSRGTFKAEEMKTVGDLYDRLTVFLNTLAQAQQNEQTQSNQGETNDN